MINLRFEIKNAAFDPNDHDTLREACDILHTATEDVMKEALSHNNSGCSIRLNKLIQPIKDSNGNTIGTLTYTKDS